jgi:hypothetical protein
MGTMIHAADVPRGLAGLAQDAPAYTPGVCNIGPAEIAMRRRAGHVGAVATAGLLGGLLLARSPRPVRMVVALPAAASASGYLQARSRFCAGFGSRGVFNFGELGQVVVVADTEARARDRAKAMEIGLASLAIGVGVGLVTLAIPR